MSTPGKHLAVYCRFSIALNGQVENVEDQEAWGRDFHQAHAPHLPIVVYVDNDRSAAKDDVVREDFDRLRANIAAGKVAVAWASETSRWERRGIQWLQLLAEWGSQEVEMVTMREGVVRPDDVTSEIRGLLNWDEIRKLRRRVNDKLDRRATQGRPGPGTSFGYRNVRDENQRAWLVVQQREADAARRAAARILDEGWSYMAVAREWNRLRIPTRRNGKQWTGSRVRDALLAPTIAGKRVHRGEIVGPGEWDPILDEITWQRLRALANGSKRPRGPQRYLLSGGLTKCPYCETNISGENRPTKTSGPNRSVYGCPRSRGGCGGVYVLVRYLDAYVTEKFLGMLDSDEFRARLVAGDAHADDRKRITDRLAANAARRVELARQHGSGDLGTDEWEASREGLLAEKAMMTEQLAAVPPPVLDVDPDAIVADWPDLTLMEQRHALRLFLSRIELRRTSKRGPGFDPDRVTIYDRDGNEV